MESLRTLLERRDPSSRPSLLETCDDIFSTDRKTFFLQSFFYSSGSKFHNAASPEVQGVHSFKEKFRVSVMDDNVTAQEQCRYKTQVKQLSLLVCVRGFVWSCFCLLQF